MKDQFIYGIRAIIEAAGSDRPVNKVWLQDGLKGPLMNELRQVLAAQEIPYQFVPQVKLNKLTTGNHQGAVAFISSVNFQPIEEVITSVYENGESPLVVVCDRVTDVRNLGAIARSALCAGAHALLFPSRGGALINEDAIKTSAGALLHLPVCRTPNLKTTLRYLTESGLSLLACTEKGEKTIFEAAMDQPLAIIMGSEEDGISPEYLKLCDQAVKIPMAPVPVSSLNVSVAAGIVLFECRRQRLAGLS